MTQAPALPQAGVATPAAGATAAPRALPRRLARAASIADLERLARRRLPRFVYDYLAGGAGDETGLRRDRAAFAATTLTPRVLRDVSAADPGVTLFGRRYAWPFGVSPIGLGNLVWPGAELTIARHAADWSIPYVLSTPASTAIEVIAAAIPGHAWFQLYVSPDERVTGGLLDRARAAGIEVLVVTVDVPWPGRRDRDIRNGFTLPFRLDAATLWQLATHPRWSLSTLLAGPPSFANLAPYADPGAGSQSLAAFMARQISGRFDGAALAAIRRRWAGPLVVKGILHRDDASAAVAAGADGIWVSSHGGRQFAAAPAALSCLAPVAEAAMNASGGRATVLLDSGVTSGLDVARGRTLGAAAVFTGRPWMLGMAAGGAAGVERVAQILSQEYRAALAMADLPRG